MAQLASGMPAGSHERILIVLVGLPARGKSYVSNKITSFCEWRCIHTRTFNVGALRRKAVVGKQDAGFFSFSNEAARAKREEVAMEVLRDALSWLATGGNVAILDATNTTRERRRRVLQEVRNAAAGDASKIPYVVFVEVICNDAAVLRSNMLQKVTNSPDYRGQPVDVALADLAARIAEYEKVYQPVDEEMEDKDCPIGPISYIKLIDMQSKVICRNIYGPTAFLIVSYLMVIHIGARPIWLVRAGQCTDDAVRAAIRRNVDQAGMTPRANGASATDAAPAAGSTLAAAHAALQAGGAIRRGSVPNSLTAAAAADVVRSQIAAGLQSLPQSFASTALSAGLTLNAQGKRFAYQMAKFALRRTASGEYHPTHELPPLPYPPDRVVLGSAPPSAKREPQSDLGFAIGDHAADMSTGDGTPPAHPPLSESTATPGQSASIVRSTSGGSGMRRIASKSVMRLTVQDTVLPARISGLGDTPIAEVPSCSSSESAAAKPTLDAAMAGVKAKAQAGDSLLGPATGRSTTPAEHHFVSPRGVASSGFVTRRIRATTRGTSVRSLTAEAGTDCDGSPGESPAVSVRASGDTPQADADSPDEHEVEDEDAVDGIVVSAPVIAQDNHYKAEGGAAAPRKVEEETNELIVFDAAPAVYTSTLPRTIEMAEFLPFPSQQHSALNPMETGICMGIPLQYLEAQFPEEYARWAGAADRAKHRITGGESLYDVVQRLTPFVVEIERQRRPVLVISHLSTLQVLLAYFKGVPLQDCIHLEFPMNTIIEFRSHQYGWIERRYTFTQAVREAAEAPHVDHIVW